LPFHRHLSNGDLHRVVDAVRAFRHVAVNA
jgi:hypothetical protein